MLTNRPEYMLIFIEKATGHVVTAVVIAIVIIVVIAVVIVVVTIN